MGYSLGIDLGTTYTAAAVARAGKVEPLTLGEQSVAIPTVVLLRDDGEVLVGEAAERRALSEPERVAREFKRRIGDPVPIIVGGTPYGAEALAALVLARVVAIATEQEGEAPERVSVTHPASWTTFKLDLLQQAIGQAGLVDVLLLSEPEAAAVQYSQLERLDDGEVVAVYDFGGGTFDAAVLRRRGVRFDLLGTPQGLERLGGIDVDQAVLSHVDQAVGGQIGTVDRGAPGVATGLARLAAECRAAKEALSGDTDAVVAVNLPGLQTEVRVTRVELEAMLRPRLAETVAALDRAVRTAGLLPEDVGRVLLVGGTSRIPLVAATVREQFGRPVAVDANPKLVVCLGAARWAETAGMAAGAAPGWPGAQATTAAVPAVAPVVAPAAPPAVEPTVPIAAPVAAPPAPPPVATPPAAPAAVLTPVPTTAHSRPLVLVAAAVVVVLLAVVGVLALGGGGGDDGDDERAVAFERDPDADEDDDEATTTTTEAEPEGDEPEEVDEVTTPEPPPGEDLNDEQAAAEAVTVFDDSGSFSVQLPAVFETNTQTLDLFGTTVAHVSGAADIDQYLSGDFSVFGVSALVADAVDVGSVEDALTAFLPGPTCATELPAEPFQTNLGGGLILRFEDCGGDNSEALAAIDLPQFGAIALVAAQGPGPVDDIPAVLVEAVFSSLTPA